VNRPRVLFVSRTRYRLPLAPGTAVKFDTLADELDVHVFASAAPDSTGEAEGFHLVAPLRAQALGGLAFWLLLPWRVARLLRRLRPVAAMCQTAYEGAAVLLARRLAGVPVKVVVEVHADWRTSTRLYGSGLRHLLAPLGDRLAAWALRRADAIRTVSPFTDGLVRELGLESTAQFPAYMELRPFLAPRMPLPERPQALFVGVLEAYKNVDGLAAAWALAAPRVPQASLRVVGKGTRAEVVESLVREHGVTWDRELPAEGVAAALDEAWVLVLPSRSEGMGRVLVEAFCRGRGVVGTRTGSIPNLVEDDVSGLLVEAGDAAALADALVRVLSDRGLAERLGAGAADAAAPWLQTPEEYARRVRELIA
jgi:glycosyltransferase involved in cell wall biosynthesis